MTYLALDAAEIVGTIERLQGRIEERFPGSGLGRVCGQLLEIARNARERAVWIAKPILPLRIASAALAVVIIAGLSLMVIQLRPPPGQLLRRRSSVISHRYCGFTIARAHWR